MFRLLTVASEYGGGGSLIAQRVAEKLGWRLLDRALSRAVAQAAQVDEDPVRRYVEHVDSWWHRFNCSGLWAAAIQAGVPVADDTFFDGQAVAQLAQKVIAQAAGTCNCVIVGRGAQYVLHGRDDVLHVFVYGPWEERVSRVRNRGEARDDAEVLIRLTDRERARYIRTHYGCDWKDPHLYHMMVNSQIGVESASQVIADAVRQGDRA